MLPYADGDVSDLQGMHFFDDQSLPSANDPAPKYEFLVMGADHDLFNSVWTQGLFPAGAADDWAGVGTADPNAPVRASSRSVFRLPPKIRTFEASSNSE